MKGYTEQTTPHEKENPRHPFLDRKVIVNRVLEDQNGMILFLVVKFC